MEQTTDLPIVDGHLHYNSAIITDSILQHRKLYGGIATTGSTDWQASLELASSNHLGICLGIHPWSANHHNEGDLAALEKLVLQNPHAQIGECGLHKTTDRQIRPDLDIQLYFFERQLEIANRHQRNVCIHSWGYDHKTLEILPKETHTIYYWHGLNCSPDFLKEVQKRNIILGIGNQIWKWPESKRIAFFQNINPNLIMIESDSPYQMQSASDLDTHVHQLSHILGISASELLHISINNWLQFYGKSAT